LSFTSSFPSLSYKDSRHSSPFALIDSSLPLEPIVAPQPIVVPLDPFIISVALLFMQSSLRGRVASLRSFFFFLSPSQMLSSSLSALFSHLFMSPSSGPRRNSFTLMLLCATSVAVQPPSSPFHGLLKFLIGFICFWTSLSTVYALPGTNHLLVNDTPSLDIVRQHRNVETILTSLTRTTNQTIATNASTIVPTETINSAPYCFVVDTDITDFCIDTGVNRPIVNNPRPLNNFKAVSSAGIKGVGGMPVQIAGVGCLNLPLVSDDGNTSNIIMQNAVYVPTSLYNLIPPQLLLSEVWLSSGSFQS